MAKGPAAAQNKKDNTKQPSKTSTLHPPYFQMICEAISTLKDRTGSSQQAISKLIEENYGKMLPPNFKKVLSIQLKKFVKSERLVKVKNSFKISPSEKKPNMTSNSNSTTTTNYKKEAAKKVSEKAKKTKRLSQVKTPEALKKKVSKVKNLNQNKTPEGSKKKKNLTPMKRKGPKNVTSSRPQVKKKARK